MSVTDKLAELRATAAERVHYSTITRDEQLQLIAAVEALRTGLIAEVYSERGTSTYTEAHVTAQVDKIITDAAPMLGGESC